jgi:AmmeMemoRadiSam system protein B
MNSGALVFVGIAPHPPVMVPEVGGASAEEVRDSIEAMRELTLRINACGAESIILISPHAPLEERAFVAYDGPRLRGDFANFRAPHATVDVELDAGLLGAIEAAANEEGFRVTRLRSRELDHGTAVPLYFLARNGWGGRCVALGYSFLSDEDHLRFGVSVARAVERLGRATAFVASGDLSHRLKPGAPAGFNPEARRFDEEVVNACRECEPARVAKIDRNLRRLAGECGYRSMLVAIGASSGVGHDCDVLHYEAPFGVGYLVAQIARTCKH